MASRTQSISTKIVILLVVPLISLTALWGYVAVSTYTDSSQLLRARTFDQKLVKPTHELVEALQHERRMSMAFLGGDRSLDRSGFLAQRAATDRARATYGRGVSDRDARGVVEAEMLKKLDDFGGRLTEVDRLRTQIDNREIGRPRVLSAYSSLIDESLNAFKGHEPPKNAEIARDFENLARLGAGREMLSRADALATGSLLAQRFTAAEFDQFEQLTAAYRYYYTDLEPSLAPADRTRYRRFAESPQYSRYQALENRLLRYEGHHGPIPVDAGAWHTASEAVISGLREFEGQVLDDTTQRSRDTAVAVFSRLALASGLGLLAVIVSAAVAWRIARRLVTESRTMAEAVTEFTGGYLPALSESVRRGEPIDLDKALPRPDFTVTEIDRIAESFTEAGREVIIATTREIEARRGISEVFVVLARRSQALLHRQLSLLDNMQRRTEDPAGLTDLFQLDHLATRMRRHAEGLVILAGKTAGRTWRTPVPFIDVVRGAVAEVEDYTRVRVLPMPGAALTGTAVADMIHLLAELVENATLFSPPQAPVQVSGQAVPSGYVLEIEDRGLGLEPDVLEDINRKLLNPPEFDLSDMARLGLFVVARLAQRHEVRVSLRASPYGGTTAIVLIPSALIVEPDADARVPGDLRITPPGLGDGTPEPEPARVPAMNGSAERAPEPRPEPRLTMAGGEQDLPRRRRQADREPGEGSDGELPRRRRKTPQPEGGTVPLGAPVAEPAGGLPKRRRQANLAPELRERRDVTDKYGGPAAPVAEEDDRPPADLRVRMAAMQRGWQRGRIDAREAEASGGDVAASGTEEDSS